MLQIKWPIEGASLRTHVVVCVGEHVHCQKEPSSQLVEPECVEVGWSSFKERRVIAHLSLFSTSSAEKLSAPLKYFRCSGWFEKKLKDNFSKLLKLTLA